MSADNSQPSGKNQPQSNNRLERARQQAMAQATGASAPQSGQRPDSSTTAATARQARQDREQRRGRGREIDELSALFTPNAGAGNDGGISDKSGDPAARRDVGPDDRGAGHSDRSTTERPALELDDDDEGEAPKPGRKNSLNGFLEEHELKPKAIFDLEVSFDGDGSIEPATIGELKDHYVKTREFERVRDEFEDWRESAQLEVMQARSQLDDVVNRLTQVVPPDMLARAFTDMQEGQANALERARRQLAEWFPQWSDVQVKIKDRERLEKALATYGFSRAEIGNVADARLIKFAFDAINLRERYQRLREGTREKQPTRDATSNRKERKQSAIERADAIARSGDKIGAIASLIPIGVPNGNAKP
jgi:hypothetical protein